MRALVCLCIFAGTVLPWNPQAFWENSFGIVPLQSTRADVERLYGISSDSCRCNFQTPTEAINVAFATAPCALPVYGWNVPKDTVLSFRVTPRVPRRFSEMASDLNGFVKRYSPEDIATTYYTNVNKGIVFDVQDAHVVSITYFPANKENAKRCLGFPPFDGVPQPRPFDTIFNPDKSEVEARLGNLAIELSKNNRYRGYIVAYAGKISLRGEAKRMAEDARSYLIEREKISPDRIVAIDGGYRDTAQYDVFMLGLEMPPPTPTPTVPSNEVQIVRAKKKE